MMMRILMRRTRRELAKELLKHPVKGTRALVKGRGIRNKIKSPAGVMALGALVAVPVGLMALKRARAR